MYMIGRTYIQLCRQEEAISKMYLGYKWEGGHKGSYLCRVEVARNCILVAHELKFHPHNAFGRYS